MREHLRNHNFASIIAALCLILILSIFHGCSSGRGDNSSGIQGHWEAVTGTNATDERYYNFDIFSNYDTYYGLVKISTPSGIIHGPIVITYLKDTYEFRSNLTDSSYNFVFKGIIKINDGKKIFKGNIKQGDSTSYYVQLAKTIDDPCV